MMGTNYYAATDRCPHCGRADEKLHIGKSSFGWAFLFRAHLDYAPRPLTSWAAWRELLAQPGTVITNEYDEVVALEDFESMVDGKRGLKKSSLDETLDPEGYPFSAREFW
jgi:hypothetical protein